MSAIFISYRRDDAEGHAGRLFEDLVDRFGSDTVFMDVAGIDPGRDFRKVIDQKVAECGVLLAMIGKNWLDAADESGARRIDNARDFVRIETSSALQRDIPVIPVLVQGATMPQAEQLPQDLADLAYRNAVELTHARWASDVQVLIGALERLNVGVPRTERPRTGDGRRLESSPAPVNEPAPVAAAPGGETIRPMRSGVPRSTLMVGAVLLLVLAFAGYELWLAGDDEPSATSLTEDVGGRSVAEGSSARNDHADTEPQGFDISGLDISEAEYATADGGPVAGSFRQTADRVWSEYGANGEKRFTFREAGRDDWTIELWDDARNVGVQLDLEERAVNYKRAPNAPYTKLYSLVDVR